MIEISEGKLCFLGSINETKSAFAENYEILWEDNSPEGATWVEEEFEALWKDAFPLPEAILEEIKRVADRVEIRFEETKAEELAARRSRFFWIDGPTLARHRHRRAPGTSFW